MQYISREEFLNQTKEIQDFLKVWWKENLQAYDLYKTTGKRSDILCIQNNIEYINAVKDLINDAIPLLTESQLRNFIEEKLDGCNIYFQSYTNGDTKLIVEYEYSKGIEDCDVGEYEVKCEDMLEGYWKIACMVADTQIKEEEYWKNI